MLEKLSPQARRTMLQCVENGPSQETEEFCRIKEGLLTLIVCTSLTDEEATVRVNLVPSGTARGWALCGDPVPCDTDPETHRHVVFEC